MSRASKRRRYIDAVVRHVRRHGVEVVALLLDDERPVDFIRRDGLDFEPKQADRLDKFKRGYFLFGGPL